MTLPNFVFNNCSVTIIQNVSNCNIYLGSSGAKITPNTTQRTLEERVAQPVVINNEPPVITMSDKLKELSGKKLKDSVNPNTEWKDSYQVEDYFDDITSSSSSSSSSQTIKEWVESNGEKGKTGKFVKYLEDDKGMTGVKSFDEAPSDIQTLWDEFEATT